ncbi:TPA: alpha/beta fold hydrolase [Pseudomonas aeruginosa]
MKTIDIAELIEHWMSRIETDEVLSSYAEGLNVGVTLKSDNHVFMYVKLTKNPSATSSPVENSANKPDMDLTAPLKFWENLLRGTWEPGAHAFGASLSTNVGLIYSGEKYVQSISRAALERLLELARPPVTDEKWLFDPSVVVGHYADVSTKSGKSSRIYYETAGTDSSKTPVLFLHTAGADSRQFHFQLASPQINEERLLLSFDLPRHGKSLPVQGESPFIRKDLTPCEYVDWCVSFIESVCKKPVIIAGCSMGSMAALMVGAQRPDLIRGVIAIEAPDKSPERRSVELLSAKIDQMRFVPTYVRGLMNPSSPEAYRDLATWIYSQGGFGTYEADVGFYSSGFDGNKLVTSYADSKIPIRLITGSYDYSATPESSRKLQSLLPNSSFSEMNDLGHFPMIENPQAFNRHLEKELAALDLQLMTG